MNRRNFIRLASAGAATGIIAPQAVLAGVEASDSMAGGIYYTKDAPGRWSKKVGGHLPSISVSKGDNGVSVQVVTSHEMKGYEHYIVKHMLLDQDFNFIEEVMFDPMKTKAPITEHNLGNYSGRLHVLSVCNKHDSWLNTADV